MTDQQSESEHSGVFLNVAEMKQLIKMGMDAQRLLEVIPSHGSAANGNSAVIVPESLSEEERKVRLLLLEHLEDMGFIYRVGWDKTQWVMERTPSGEARVLWHLHDYDEADWFRMGVPQLKARQWHEHGFDLTQTRKWIKCGFGLSEAALWRSSHFTPQQAADAVARGSGIAVDIASRCAELQKAESEEG